MNNNKLSKVLTLVALVISLVGAYFYIMIMVNGNDAFKPEAGESALALQNSIISPFVWFTIIVLGATVIATLASSIISMLKKPEQLKKTLLSVAILAVVLVIAYFMHNGDAVYGADGNVLEGGEADSTPNVWSSTGIWYSVILGGVGLALFLVDMVKSLVKS